MSLDAMWAGTQAGCAAAPQHGYFSVEPPAAYRVVYSLGGTRHSFSFFRPVIVEFDNSSPPQRVRMIFNDKPVGESSTDPIASVEAYLGVCGSMGFGLGSSHWFGCAVLALLKGSQGYVVPDWVHVQYYGDNAQSVGFCSYLASPP